MEARVNRVVKFDDDDVDKYWLCGLSPHTVLKHTKGDLGLWEKITDDGAKEIWDALPQEKKDEYGYEYELMRCHSPSNSPFLRHQEERDWGIQMGSLATITGSIQSQTIQPCLCAKSASIMPALFSLSSLLSLLSPLFFFPPPLSLSLSSSSSPSCPPSGPHGSIVQRRPVAPLNASDRKSYDRACRPRRRPRG